MGKCYVDSGGNANNSGSRDSASALYAITVHATYAGGTTIPIVEAHDLSVLNTSGANQDSVNFTDATNTTQDIFWISGVDNAASPKTITVTVAPTGLTAGASTGNIGGQITGAGLSGEEAFTRAGDVVIYNNSPAAQVGALFSSRNSGDKTGGRITVMGKAGVRPVLNTTGNTTPLNISNSHGLWFIDNFELDCDGSTGVGFTTGASDGVNHNVKVTDSGSGGAILCGAGLTLNCEASGSAGQGLSTTGGSYLGVYLHNNASDGVRNTANNGGPQLFFSIIESNTGRGVYHSGAPSTITHQTLLFGCTIWDNDDSGVEAADDDAIFTILNSIIAENGNGSTSFNSEFPGTNQADLLGFHAYNIFYRSSGTNLNNLTVNANLAGTELTTDPQFTDAAGGNFGIASGSPAKAVGFPGTFLGSASIGYLDIGAVQRQEAGGGGGASSHTFVG